MKRGFTLIEILIVVAIIAILASVVLVGLGPTQQAGRDARRLSDLREAQNALELYFSKCGYYPGPVVASNSPCGPWSQNPNGWASLTTALTGSGIGVGTMPDDPTAGHDYYYSTTGDGSSYIIAAKLENANNSVFSTYQAPDISNYNGSVLSCDALDNMYCITL
jgi:prepilin-type N-terminal cleavage/methylation domain-containing protein